MNIDSNMNKCIDKSINQWHKDLRNIALSSETEDEMYFELQLILTRIVDNLCVRIEDKLSGYEY
jgi:hypothetical protein